MTGMNIVGIIISVAIIAGLIFAMAKMSDSGADANGCSGNCSSCGIPDDSKTGCSFRDEQK